MTLRSLAVLAVTSTVLACGQDPEPERASEPPPAPEPPAAPAPPEPAPPPPEPEPEPEPPTPLVLDPLTVTEIEARVVALLGPKHWTACGVIHSVGAVEVEVLGVGEPPPRMILFVSCPVDFGNRQLLVEGERIAVTLHARKQMWPKPAAELPADVPVRYVKRMRPVVGP